MGRKTIHLCQLHESVNEQELYQQRSLSLFPPLGQSIALQYQLEGNFHMLPIKLYPSFIPRHTYKKVFLVCFIGVVGADFEGSLQAAPEPQSKDLEDHLQVPRQSAKGLLLQSEQRPGILLLLRHYRHALVE